MTSSGLPASTGGGAPAPQRRAAGHPFAPPPDSSALSQNTVKPTKTKQNQPLFYFSVGFVGPVPKPSKTHQNQAKPTTFLFFKRPKKTGAAGLARRRTQLWFEAKNDLIRLNPTYSG